MASSKKGWRMNLVILKKKGGRELRHGWEESGGSSDISLPGLKKSSQL